MDTHIKDMIHRDYVRSGKDLGSFALDWMKTYDEVCYELVIVNATSHGNPVKGKVIVDSMKKITEAIEFYQIEGEYRIDTVDTQKEFFLLLSEIRDELI